jgi:hypothetical protein
MDETLMGQYFDSIDQDETMTPVEKKQLKINCHIARQLTRIAEAMEKMAQPKSEVSDGEN